MSNKTTIRVCETCKAPLIFTFCWAYNERYCLNCGRVGGMMGTGDDVKMTKRLKYEDKVIDDVWEALYKNLIPRSRYTKDKCKKCNGQDHNEHLSRKEILKDKVATKILKKLNEGFL